MEEKREIEHTIDNTWQDQILYANLAAKGGHVLSAGYVLYCVVSDWRLSFIRVKKGLVIHLRATLYSTVQQRISRSPEAEPLHHSSNEVSDAMQFCTVLYYCTTTGESGQVRHAGLVCPLEKDAERASLTYMR